MHRMGQLQAVDTAGHLNIGEQQRDVRAGLKNRDCFVGIDGFDRVKPASSTMSTARMRRIISSSTIRTFGTSAGSVDMGGLTASSRRLGQCSGTRQDAFVMLTETLPRFQASKIRQAQSLLRLSGTNSELNYVNPRF